MSVANVDAKYLSLAAATPNSVTFTAPSPFRKIRVTMLSGASPIYADFSVDGSAVTAVSQGAKQHAMGTPSQSPLEIAVQGPAPTPGGSTAQSKNVVFGAISAGVAELYIELVA